jgi:hypothetical protein
MNNNRLYLGLAIFICFLVVALLVAASLFERRFDPYIRDQAVQYLEAHFDSKVELGSLRVRLANTSSLRVLLSRERGGLAHVQGEGMVLRYKGREDIPPMFTIKKFGFDVDLGTVFGSQKKLPLVTLDGIEINIPPKGERPSFRSSSVAAERESYSDDTQQTQPSVVIEQIIVKNAKLIILPRRKEKVPLQFDIYNLRLESVGRNVPMKYDATLTNPKPPGDIRSTGTFGPWASKEPGDTPLAGKYVFENGDLGVFKAIAGILHSTGTFEGTLSELAVKGEASVPDFRLRRSGNPVPLSTRFEALVDGTNGDTILRPVSATLGTTAFTTSGAVIKHEGDRRRTIKLNATMPKGNLRDVLLLAMKGSPLMEGQIALKTSIHIPPLSGKVKKKLILDGQFEVFEGKFLKSRIQDQLDNLSRRGQGQPKNEEIDEVISMMGGTYHLEDEVITFRALSFTVPGAAIDLTGDYDLENDVLDYHGTLQLEAKVSQTMTGWKRWILKPVDPFFSKHGAGTFLRIKVTGSSKQPQFGLDKGSKTNGGQPYGLQ